MSDNDKITRRISLYLRLTEKAMKNERLIDILNRRKINLEFELKNLEDYLRLDEMNDDDRLKFYGRRRYHRTKKIYKNSEKFVCECGLTIKKFSKSKHIKSQRHMKRMKDIKEFGFVTLRKRI